MSDAVTRDYSFTVRLSPDEKAALETLAEHFDLDKSATLRRTLQLAMAENTVPLSNAGQFIPLRTHNIAFPIRLSAKEAREH